MKICKIYIKGFQQFQDVELDFTNPETGEPLEKLCFIGRNGTGKSKILKLINWFFNSVLNHLKDSAKYNPNLNEEYQFPKVIFEFVFDDKEYFIFYFKKKVTIYKSYLIPERKKELVSILFSFNEIEDARSSAFLKDLTSSTLLEEFITRLVLNDNNSDLLIYSPAEANSNEYKKIVDVPKTSVDEAIKLNQNYPYYSEVSQDTINEFWKLLVFNLRKRAEERDLFENLPQNVVKTKIELINEFDAKNPKMLEILNRVWERLLSKAGLYFDVKGVNNPYQLNDNLRAYIKLLKSGETIRYGNLSTGIRNYIFRLGHIFSLYFNREIDRGFLLVDEPENSLYPDFLFDLVETYQQVIIDRRGQNNTQMFFATHSPIIAAQFEPYERIILDWNDDATINVRKGVSPVGDDPNDILTNDFELENLMGPEGRKMWNEYLTLKKKLIRENNKDKKDELIHEIEKIGSLYNF